MSIQKQVTALKNLGLTDAEVADVLECDKAIDQGKKLFEQTAEQKTASKKARKAGNTKGYCKKVDPERVELLTRLAESVGCEVTVTKPQREFMFKCGDVDYRVTLSTIRK